MTEPVRPTSKSELKERFSLSSRLAVRVGALWQKGVGISEATLELAGENDRMEEFLLTDALLEHGENLKEDHLEEVLKDMGGEGPEEPVAVDPDGQRPVICLEEEQLAEEVWTGEEKPEGKGEETRETETPLPAMDSDQSDAGTLLDDTESEPLFDDEEVNQIKLKILTGVNPEEKMESIRKLSYASVDDRKKGMILLQALSDESSSVREEAARGLAELGLSEELSDTIQSFLSEDLEQKKFAAEKLRNMAEDCTEFEKATIVAFLVSDLNTEERTEARKVIIQTLLPYSSFIAENARDHLPKLTRNLLDVLVSDFEEVQRPIKQLYDRLGEHVPEVVSEIIWEETKNVEGRILKAYLLMLLAEIPIQDDRSREVNREMVEIIAGWNDTEIECRRLGNTLIQQGEHGVRAIIDHFDEADEQQQAFLLRLLDEMLLEVTPDEALLEEITSFLVEVSRRDTRKLREALLDLRLLYLPLIPPETREKIAGLLMDSLHRYENERIGNMIPIVLENMGTPIIDVLLNYLMDPTYEVQFNTALDVLSAIFYDVDEDELDDEQLEEVHEHLSNFNQFLDRRLEDDEADVRSIIPAQARALSGDLADRDQVREKLNNLQDRVDERDRAYPSLEGLGWLASSENVSEERAMDIGISFLGYLESDLPEEISSEMEDENGRKLMVDQETRAYTELIPTVVDGLKRICCRETLPDSFREKIISSLMDTWHELVDFNLVWGPASVTRLAQNLGEICRSPYTRTERKEEILEGLARKIDNLSLVETVGDILGEGMESSGIRQTCEKITKALLEMLEMPDYQDPEDRRILLENLGKICSRRNIAGGRKTNKHLRKKIIDALVDGMYDNIDGTKTSLEELAENEKVPKKYRSLIRQKLDRFTG